MMYYCVAVAVAALSLSAVSAQHGHGGMNPNVLTCDELTVGFLENLVGAVGGHDGHDHGDGHTDERLLSGDSHGGHGDDDDDDVELPDGIVTGSIGSCNSNDMFPYSYGEDSGMHMINYTIDDCQMPGMTGEMNNCYVSYCNDGAVTVAHYNNTCCNETDVANRDPHHQCDVALYIDILIASLDEGENAAASMGAAPLGIALALVALFF